MRYFEVFLAGLVLMGVGACRGPNWYAGRDLLVTNRQVAKALNDPINEAPEGRFDPASVPVFDPPKAVRPCCPFGMDLKAKVGAVTVPLYQNTNILSIDQLGPHEYDNGFVTIQKDPKRGIVTENNGLIYTCRGGFIDIAHIRDNADLTLYLTMKLARSLPEETTIELPDQGTKRRVVIKALPKSLFNRYGRWYTTTMLAQWIAFHMSTWHEVVTWYDWQSVKGFSEKLSAFSPEDRYSNAVGILIGGGIIRNGGASARDVYNHSMDAWIVSVLRRLGAVALPDSRAAMKAVDGGWWDSKKELPEWTLVRHRDLESKMSIAPWIVADSLPKGRADAQIKNMCEDQPEPLDLAIPERLGDVKFADYVSIDFEFTNAWMPENFPYPKPGVKVVTVADLPSIITAIRKDAAQTLGQGFDRPQIQAQAQAVASN